MSLKFVIKIWLSVGLALVASWSSRVLAESQYWVSVGSYTAAEAAERARDNAAERLPQSYIIAPADTANGYYFRVLAGPYLTRSLAEEVLLSARETGFSGAWLLSEPVDGASLSIPSINPSVDTGQPGGFDRYGLAVDSSLERDAAALSDSNTEKQPEREPAPTLVEKAPGSFNLHKLRRDQ